MVNFGLKQLADSLADGQKPGSSETWEEVKMELVCSEHNKEKKMLCEDQQKAVCCQWGFSSSGYLRQFL